MKPRDSIERRLEGQRIAVTGKLVSMSRDEVIERIGDAGGTYVTTPREDTDVLVIGDLAASPTEHGGALPQVAAVAVQGGRHAAATVAHRVGAADDPGPFTYRDKGSMATIGRHSAVTELPSGVRLGGPLGWLAWLALHLVMLIGFRNRANVLVNWAWNYLTYDRGSRVMVTPAASAAAHDRPPAPSAPR